MENQSLWFLENIDVTGIFCSKKLGHFQDSHTEKEYKKGAFIYLPDEDADKIFFISEGRVKIGSLGENGKEITKAILGKGEVFGELALISDNKRSDFAQAMEKTHLCVLPKDQLNAMMRERNGLSTFLLQLFGSRIMRMEKRLETLVFKDSRSRIVHFLVELNEKRGERVGYEWVVRKFLTHQEIANLTATSRQTVTTVLNELKNDNVITFDRRRLLIRELETLKNQI
jgi:CRP-like cAMP-binding protein